jgi:Fur family ferric uptake transcriptional regulator
VILDELRKVTSHPTAVELYEIVRRRLPKISLGTVYRNLDLLAEMGTIRKVSLAGVEARFDGDIGRHDHIRCVRCGRLDDVAGAVVDLPCGQTDKVAGYTVIGHRLEFVGVCPECGNDQHGGGNQPSGNAVG